ncbi:MAG: Rne/Rng family ribonuclease [Beijerinckiaceae bacterium]|nr:Rne/Rng family ribonuclease [Beijerinckiaceae bacterium]
MHPDYYQIPVADRQALVEEEARAQRDEEEDVSRPMRRSRRYRRGDRDAQHAEKRRGKDPAITGEYAEGAAAVAEVPAGTEAGVNDALAGSFDELPAAAGDFLAPPEEAAFGPVHESTAGEDHASESGLSEQPAASLLAEAIDEADRSLAAEVTPAAEPEHQDQDIEGKDAQDAKSGWAESDRTGSGRDTGEEGDDGMADVEQLGGDAMEEMPVRPHRPRKQYKIQEVIKRRQVLLVQVVKEERGNKGAALTTYLSLAGRYSVLMPNTARGGGISRKITDHDDRRRLKAIAQELEVPEGMGVIVRTAGAARTKAEVKRDFEYLLRMWETVRETTLQSSAPTLVYEEGSLIKRSIRDLYNKDIDEITVAGDDGYREAKEFMRLLMPSHAKMVQPYRDRPPLFTKSGVETQLDAMFSNQVTLKSGGYIVINQTEALVAIDVNSGRSTREHNIEDTALRTNLEAADEISRQLRLRDLAGLIVIDFIDMEESRNNRTVERRLKDALKNDRARIQIGRMSHFGLLEMSRQRMRAGVIEGSTVACPHCAGSGTVRATASISLHVLRALEDSLIKNSDYDITVKTRTSVALYILNQKRSHLRDLEKRFGVSLTIDADDDLTNTAYYALKHGEPAEGVKEIPASLHEAAPGIAPFEEALAEPVEAAPARDGLLDDSQPAGGLTAGDESRESDGEGFGRQRRRRRRRRGRGADREGSGIAANAPQPPDDALEAMAKFGALQPLAASPAEAESEVRPISTGGETGAAEQHPRRGGHGSRPARGGGRRAQDALLPEAVADREPVAAAGDMHSSSETLGEGKRQRGRRPRRASGPKESTSLQIPGEGHITSANQIEVPNAVAPPAPDEANPPVDDAQSGRRELNQSGHGDAEAPAGADEGRADLQDPPNREEEDLGRPKRSGWWQRARAGWRG